MKNKVSRSLGYRVSNISDEGRATLIFYHDDRKIRSQKSLFGRKYALECGKFFQLIGNHYPIMKAFKTSKLYRTSNFESILKLLKCQNGGKV